MLGRLSIALLLAASPALAQDAAPAEPAEAIPAAEAAAEAPAAPVAYKTKRVCRSVAVVGSKMPRTTCTTRKIPIRTETREASAGGEPAQEAESQL